MINYYYRSIKDTTIIKPEKLRKGSWIFAYDLSPEDASDLVELGYDESLLEDAGDYFEVPRFEYEEGIYYFFTRYVIHTKDGELSTAPLLIALSDKHLLTISHQKPEFLDTFAHGRATLITTQKVKAFLIILETLVDNYNRSLMKIRRRMLKYLGNVGNISEDDIRHFVGIESTLADYVSALAPTSMALSSMLSRHRNLELHEDDIDILEDLKLDIKQINESAQNILKTIQNIRSAHATILSHKLNVTMKTLTVVTIVLTIPNIVSSLFGMNTWLPFGQGPLGFFLILSIIGISCYLVIRWLRSKDQI